jgi:hypothetical protein
MTAEINGRGIILVADYGRSGQGWLSYMLCYILNAIFIEPYNLPAGFKYSKSDHVLSLTQGRLKGRKDTKYSLVVKSHDYPAVNFNLTEKVLYLTRDPRDVVVSGYNRERLNAKGKENKGPEQIQIKGVRARIRSLVLSSRAAYCMYTAIRWKRHVLAWKDIPHLHVTYEALATNPLRTLKGILDYLGEETEDERILKAIELFSFERITGRKRGEEDTENPEFRKGIIGDYKNHLTSMDLKILRFVCGDVASTKGYQI